jgi:hypothetical protein
MNQSNRVTITDANVIAREGSFKNDKGESVNYNTRKQTAKLEIGGFAYPFDVRLEDGQKPYEAGVYTLDLEAMVSVNKGAINLSKFPHLRPLAAAAK